MISLSNSRSCSSFVRVRLGTVFLAVFQCLFLVIASGQSDYRWSQFAGQAQSSGSSNGGYYDSEFYRPAAICTDSTGNCFVADRFNHTIRKINQSGTVSTIAGLAGVSGTANGAGANARFNEPFGVAVDSSGNIFVADRYNHSIRKITPDGTVALLAGLSGTSGSANGTGTAARFNEPVGLCLDGSGNLYVADYKNFAIRKVTPLGVVTTFAGGVGVSGFVNATGTAARFAGPVDIAWHRTSDSFYVADESNYLIRRITSGGVVTTFAGVARSAGTTDSTATASKFNLPGGVAVANDGTVFVADTLNHTIRKISGGIVSTIGGTAGVSGISEGTRTGARFQNPYRIAVRNDGAIVVSDSFNQRISIGFAASEISVERPSRAPMVSDTGNVSFGTVYTGDYISTTFTIRNLGATTLTGVSATLGGTNRTDFLVSTAPTGSVASGATTTVTVQFRPIGEGLRTAELHLASSDSDESPFVVKLSGTGALTIHTIQAGAGTNGEITPSGASQVTTGGQITFTATPARGYMVDKWLLNGQIAQTGGPTFSLAAVSQSHALQVSFRPLMYAVGVESGANGTVTPTSGFELSPGAAVTLTASPEDGYSVDTWFVNGVAQQEGGSTFTINAITSNLEVSVSFKELPNLLVGLYPESTIQPKVFSFYSTEGNFSGHIYFKTNARKGITGIDRLVLVDSESQGLTQVVFDTRGRPIRLYTTDGTSVSFTYRADGRVNVVGKGADASRIRGLVSGFESALAGASAELVAVIPELQTQGFLSLEAPPPPSFTQRASNGRPSSPVAFLIAASCKVAILGIDVFATVATAPTVAGSIIFGAKLALDAADLIAFANGTGPYAKKTIQALSFVNSSYDAVDRHATMSKALTDGRLAMRTRFDRLAKIGLPLLVEGVGFIATEYYERNEPRIVTATAAANGTISPSGQQPVAYNDSLTFIATPAVDYIVDKWEVNGAVVQQGTSTFTVANILADTTVRVTFKPARVQVSASAGGNGAIFPSGIQTIDNGGGISFSATPSVNYAVDQWIVDGVARANGGGTFSLVNVQNDTVVLVTFKRNVATISPSAGSNGAIYPLTAQTVVLGSSIQFTATPNTGYVVDQWLLDGVVVQSGGNSCTLTGVSGDATLRVTFKQRPVSFTYTGTLPSRGTTIVSAQTGSNVSASVSGTITVSYDAPSDEYSVSVSWALVSPSYPGTSVSNAVTTTAPGAPPSVIQLSLADGSSGAEVSLTKGISSYSGTVDLRTQWQTTYGSNPKQSGVATTTHTTSVQ